MIYSIFMHSFGNEVNLLWVAIQLFVFQTYHQQLLFFCLCLPKSNALRGYSWQIYSLVVGTNQEVKEEPEQYQELGWRNRWRLWSERRITGNTQTNTIISFVIQHHHKRLEELASKSTQGASAQSCQELDFKYLGIMLSSHDISHITRMNASPRTQKSSWIFFFSLPYS